MLLSLKLGIEDGDCILLPLFEYYLGTKYQVRLAKSVIQYIRTWKQTKFTCITRSEHWRSVETYLAKTIPT